MLREAPLADTVTHKLVGCIRLLAAGEGWHGVCCAKRPLADPVTHKSVGCIR